MRYLALNNNPFYLFSEEMGKVLGLTEGNAREIVSGLNSITSRLHVVLREREISHAAAVDPSVQHNPRDLYFRDDPQLLEFIWEQYDQPPPECLLPVLPGLHQENEIFVGQNDLFTATLQNNCDRMRAWHSKNLTVHLPISPQDDTEDVIATLTSPEVMGAVGGPDAAEFNVSIDLENNWHKSFFGDLDHCTDLFRELDEKLVDVGRPDLISQYNFCYDHGHFTVQANQLNYDKESMLPRFFRQMRPRIKTLHLHCNDGSLDQHLPFGTLPTSPGIRRMKNLNYAILQENEQLLLTQLPILQLDMQDDWTIVTELGVPYTFEELVHMGTLILEHLS